MLELGLECDERVDRLTGQLVCGTDDGGFGHAFVEDEGGFDLSSRQTVAGDVDDICMADETLWVY